MKIDGSSNFTAKDFDFREPEDPKETPCTAVPLTEAEDNAILRETATA